MLDKSKFMRFLPFFLTVDESLLDYTSTKSLEENMQHITTKTTFETLPAIVYLHLMRYEYNAMTANYNKCNARFEVPNKLNLNPYLDAAEVSTEAYYTLQSVVAHRGDISRGHYVVFIDPSCDGKWYEFNDEIVKRCTQRNAIDDNFGCTTNGETCDTPEERSNAYIVVYIRDSNPTDTVHMDTGKNSSTEYLLDANTDPAILPNDVNCSDFCDTNQNIVECEYQISRNNEPPEVQKKLKHRQSKNIDTKKTEKCGKPKKKHKASQKDLISAFKNMERRLMSAIRKNTQFKMSNAESSLCLPNGPDDDGKIQALEGVRVYFSPYLQAADANNMRKRLNAVVDAMWTKEQQLHLTVDAKHVNCYKRISVDELNNIRKICLNLQKHQHFDPIGLMTYMTKWISCKLKNQRHRLKTTTTKTKRGKQNPEIRTVSSPNLECIENSDPNKIKRKVKLSQKDHPTKKRKRIVSSATSSENEDCFSTGDTTSQERDKCDEPRSFSYFVSLLQTSRYPSQMINSEDIEAVPSPLYNWEEIVKEMKWSDAELNRVMTPDSHVIIDGKYCNSTVLCNNTV